jgi:hypothetical protein
MPTLVVHTRQLQDARDLLREIGVQAELVSFEGREREPRPEDRPGIAGAEVAFVGIRKDYRRAAERLGCVTRLEIATVRGGRTSLVEWLCPATPRVERVLTPREAFERGAREEGRLILAEGCLDAASDLVPSLHEFVAKAVVALRDLAAANARAPQGLERFFSERGVAFAPSGGVAFRYRVVDGTGQEILPLTPKQHKHLKQGDHKKTPEECARIYFGLLEQSIIIARCGPHPDTDFEVVVRRL